MIILLSLNWFFFWRRVKTVYWFTFDPYKQWSEKLTSLLQHWYMIYLNTETFAWDETGGGIQPWLCADQWSGSD